LQSREDARRDFQQRILMKQSDNKNRSADHGGHEAHQHGQHVSLHRTSSPLAAALRHVLGVHAFHDLFAQGIQAIHDAVRFHIDQRVPLGFLIAGLHQNVMILAQVW